MRIKIDYDDFEIEIGQGLGREYPVAVINSPAGHAQETMTFPFDELALENRLKDLQIALLRSGGARRQLLSKEEQSVQDFGQKLFQALVNGEIRNRYDVSRSQAQQQHKGLRLKLRFKSPELAALPWEFMFDARRREYLCLNKDTPAIRYLELPQPIMPLTMTPPLRVLGMVASPADLPRLDEDREKQRIEAAVKQLRDTGVVELEWLPGQSWRHLQRAMRQGPWHIFHFIGHGGYDHACDEGCIALVNDSGQNHLLRATQLARLLAGHHTLRLAVLNSCEGAKGSGRDIFSSTAAILVYSGIAAVLAMQYEITDRAAIEFSQVFYEALADGLPVDAAVTEARIAVNIAVNNTLEWGTPVLYMRSSDGVLFEPRTIKPPLLIGPEPSLEPDTAREKLDRRRVKPEQLRIPLAKFVIRLLIVVIPLIGFLHYLYDIYALRSSSYFLYLFKISIYLYYISITILIIFGYLIYNVNERYGHKIILSSSILSGLFVGIFLVYDFITLFIYKGILNSPNNTFIVFGIFSIISIIIYLLNYILFKYKNI